VRALGRLGLDGEQTVGRVEDEIHLAPAVSAEEVEGRGLRLPGRPAEHLVEDGRLEEGTVARAVVAGQQPGEPSRMRKFLG
jgi:hypothetical protein